MPFFRSRCSAIDTVNNPNNFDLRQFLKGLRNYTKQNEKRNGAMQSVRRRVVSEGKKHNKKENGLQF